ncbi:MAG TPA: DUF5666 domain-containing protein [Rubricoccaceae bacterium]|jgi:hypothetical protein
MRTLLLGTALLTLAACDSGTSTPATVRYSVDGASAVQYTAADGSTQSATTTGAWQKDVSAEDGSLVALTAISATGAPVTASIAVEDRLVSSRHGASVRVEARSHHGSDDSGEAEVHGFVEALGADRVTVSGRVFVVTSATRLFDDNNATVALATFIVGTYVEAEGVPLADGTFRATKIKIEDEDDGDGHNGSDDGSGSGNETEVHGAIGAIDATSITVGGRVFTTTAATRYLSDRNVAVPRASFTVGTRVEAEGYALPGGALVATKVKGDDD